MKKTADTSVPIHPLLAERWSPRAFADADVAPDELTALLEAARWAPSSFNAQPWRFLVAPRSDAEGFARLGGLLVEGNAWAKEAPLLLLAAARTRFERNDKPNRHAYHDVGLALGCLTIQAEALGLRVHMMAGFDVDRARTELGLPDVFDPVTMAAVGRPGEPERLPEKLRDAERAPRSRAPLAEIAFGAGWERELARP